MLEHVAKCEGVVAVVLIQEKSGIKMLIILILHLWAETGAENGFKQIILIPPQGRLPLNNFGRIRTLENFGGLNNASSYGPLTTSHTQIYKKNISGQTHTRKPLILS